MDNYHLTKYRTCPIDIKIPKVPKSANSFNKSEKFLAVFICSIVSDLLTTISRNEEYISRNYGRI